MKQSKSAERPLAKQTKKSCTTNHRKQKNNATKPKLFVVLQMYSDGFETSSSCSKVEIRRCTHRPCKTRSAKMKQSESAQRPLAKQTEKSCATTTQEAEKQRNKTKKQKQTHPLSGNSTDLLKTFHRDDCIANWLLMGSKVCSSSKCGVSS